MTQQDSLPTYEASQASHSHSHQDNPPPYHNWQEAVPDTSIFPPPPVSGYYSSGTGNASETDADRAHEYCDKTPLWIPVLPSSAVWTDVQNANLRPVQPPEFHGSLKISSRGRWKGRSADRNGDCVLFTHLPLYFAAVDSPRSTTVRKQIYFEIKLKGLGAGPSGDGEGMSGFSIGFAARPFPSWRSPGWERGSVGVFSDDGCRFVNDSWGGQDFTSPIRAGETVGLGMVFESVPDQAATADSKKKKTSTTKLKVDVFFTRNGSFAGSWDLHEERDQDAGPLTGLEGDFDLYGAVGLFGGVDFESCFDPAGWLWKPA